MTANTLYLNQRDVEESWASATGRFETAEFSALTEEWQERARTNTAKLVQVQRDDSLIL